MELLPGFIFPLIAIILGAIGPILAFAITSRININLQKQKAFTGLIIATMDLLIVIIIFLISPLHPENVFRYDIDTLTFIEIVIILISNIMFYWVIFINKERVKWKTLMIVLILLYLFNLVLLYFTLLLPSDTFKIHQTIINSI
jgi:hypothetical protein